MRWFAQAPANIALIKYMGKKDDETNLPDNPSLSYTLNNLLSSVELEFFPGKQDIWEPLSIPGATPFSLSSTAQQRFLKHLHYLKNHFNYQGAFIVRSSNNFPLGSGLASSASSFAALTLCAVKALCEITKAPIPSIEEQANLSRVGSGSSCRSFFAPWALWMEDQITEIDIPYSQLLHQVILISHDEKEIPSREAHRLVRTSSFYASRPQRATENLKLLLNALKAQDWPSIFQICWHEFQDMHNLFATSTPPFTYITAESEQLLNKLKKFWDEHKDGPIVTMDAGPNIHLLYRLDQTQLMQQFKQENLIGNFDVL